MPKYYSHSTPIAENVSYLEYLLIRLLLECIGGVKFIFSLGYAERLLCSDTTQIMDFGTILFHSFFLFLHFHAKV